VSRRLSRRRIEPVEVEHGDHRHTERRAGRGQAVDLAEVGAQQVELGDDGVVGNVEPDVGAAFLD
jgi:hypothetical protein